MNVDAVAMDYIRIYETIERPFEILGIAILEDTTGAIPKNQVRIIEL